MMHLITSFFIVAQLNFYLSEEEILEDLQIINKVSGKPMTKKVLPLPTAPITKSDDNVYDARIDDGRLFYEKRW